MTYELTVPNTKRNRKITLALLDTFVSIDAEFTGEGIRLTTDSPATWAGAMAAFEHVEEPQP
jgi:hypothetical protein